MDYGLKILDVLIIILDYKNDERSRTMIYKLLPEILENDVDVAYFIGELIQMNEIDLAERAIDLYIEKNYEKEDDIALFIKELIQIKEVVLVKQAINLYYEINKSSNNRLLEKLLKL